uniref:Uncharacterized protein n=1 Tax=viral metagenome TaxID=1070528 RepID=A0A6C0IX73_9ZZZZ
METEPLVIDTISENETPAVDTPAVDTPAVDTPAVDTPANEENQDQTQNQTIKLTLIQLLERLLQDNEKVKKMNLTLTPDIKSFIQKLLEKEPQLFATCETSLQKIISDNKINANDIPDLMVLITIIFNAIDSFDKKDLKNVDYYELVKNILHIIIELYVEKHCDNNNENNVLLVQCALRIVDSSIELIKLRGFAKETTMIKKIISMCKKCSCKK